MTPTADAPGGGSSASKLELRCVAPALPNATADTLCHLLRAAGGAGVRWYERGYTYARGTTAAAAAQPVILRTRVRLTREDVPVHENATEWTVLHGLEVNPQLKAFPKTWPCAVYNDARTWVDATEPVIPADTRANTVSHLPNNAAQALVALGLHPAASFMRRGTVYHIDADAIAAPLLDAAATGAAAAAAAKAPLPPVEVCVWDSPTNAPDATTCVDMVLRCGDDSYRRAGEALEKMAERLERALRLPAPTAKVKREWLRPPDQSQMRKYTLKR